MLSTQPAVSNHPKAAAPVPGSSIRSLTYMSTEKLVFPNFPGGPLAIEPEQSGPNTKPCLAFAGLSADTKFLSDESKVLLLANLYLELCLNAEQAFRAARADVMTATRSTSTLYLCLR